MKKVTLIGMNSMMYTDLMNIFVSQDPKDITLSAMMTNQAFLVDDIDADLLVLCTDNVSSSILADKFKKHRILDTSQVHRDLWTYGYNLDVRNLADIKNSAKVANPGCIATGITTLLNPLLYYGIDLPIIYVDTTCGFSVGGHRMVEMYETNQSLGMSLRNINKPHTHTKELSRYLKLDNILITPKICNRKYGIQLSIPVLADDNTNLHSIYTAYYKSNNAHIQIMESPDKFVWRDQERISGAKIFAHGFGRNKIVTIAYDNLLFGGASMAYRNIKLMLGI